MCDRILETTILLQAEKGKRNLPPDDRRKSVENCSVENCIGKRGYLKIWSRIGRFWEQNRLENYC